MLSIETFEIAIAKLKFKISIKCHFILASNNWIHRHYADTGNYSDTHYML